MKDLPQTVFVVDDDDAVRDSLRMLLKSAGVHAEVCASAQEFLSSYDASQPGCLVLDVRMPGMSGLEMQHELNVRGLSMPVIFITGHGDIPMAVEAMQHGAFDFLQKPFRDQELLDRVQRALVRDMKPRTPSPHGPDTRAASSLSPRTRGARSRHTGEGKQDGGWRPGRESAHRRNSPRARDAENGSRLAG